ncbi:LOG family protein [Polluticaenibacter yanchengensis]|uniref:Cytokinin riboside 5'-monophosphate phosphoribohydrolase n=1 Tax=Polluticaenibacter yanchengensis TaxID=3014562 RepID=A0ABT4UH44_9BACT|nr:TIGR00730 family Rossman fold protein [Chitinophagaceae bacterium LY-5]
MRNIAVFCGSQNGNDEMFGIHASQIGSLIAQNNFGIVYGGSKKGLMGAVANAALEQNGAVIGIMPERLAEYDHSHNGITELLLVPDMHTRKKQMYNLCEAVIILPGGFGTMDELFEVLTWNQLAIHSKKVYILNTLGYYNDLYTSMQKMQKHGFLHSNLNENIEIHTNPVDLVAAILKN